MNKIDNTKEVLEFLKDNECYLLFGIVRTKDNDVEKSKRHKFRFIVDNKEQLLKKILHIETLSRLEPELEYRIYVSYNTRNVKNALKNFQKLLLDYSYNIESEEIVSSVRRLDLKWFSELAKPISSNKEFMLVDLDEKSTEAQNYVEWRFNVKLKLPTKNGFHYVIGKEGVEQYHKEKHLITFDISLQNDNFILVKII